MDRSTHNAVPILLTWICLPAIVHMMKIVSVTVVFEAHISLFLSFGMIGRFQDNVHIHTQLCSGRLFLHFCFAFELWKCTNWNLMEQGWWISVSRVVVTLNILSHKVLHALDIEATFPPAKA